MPVTPDATVGGSSANSYLSVADADEILDLRLGTAAWADIADDDKARAIIQATQDIDAVRFVGCKVNVEQALEFPRTGQSEPYDEIPLAILRACAYQAYELAMNLATGGRSEQQQRDRAGVISYTIGNLSETFVGPAKGPMADLYPEARKALGDWVARTGHLIGSQESPVNSRGGWGPWQ